METMAEEQQSLRRFGSVALVGRPNAGKSTLLNALLGHKAAIVSDKPQTTRHVLRGVLSEGRDQALLFDTPGFHRPLHRMNRQMMRLAEETLRRADVVALVVDAATSFGSGDSYLLKAVAQVPRPKMVLLNKVDRVAKPHLLPRIEQYASAADVAAVIPISALRRDGIENVKQVLFSLLPEGEPVFDIGARPRLKLRYEIAERIREQVLSATRDELAYTTAVRVESIDSAPESDLTRIHATVLVERVNQRKILLGRDGRMIQRIGSGARAAIEELLDGRVYLELVVRVEPDWREKESILSSLEPDLDS